MEKALRRLKFLGAERIIVTDKDAVKISQVTNNLDRIWSLGLEMKFDPSWSQIREEIFEKLHLGSP